MLLKDSFSILYILRIPEKHCISLLSSSSFSSSIFCKSNNSTTLQLEKNTRKRRGWRGVLVVKSVYVSKKKKKKRVCTYLPEDQSLVISTHSRCSQLPVTQLQRSYILLWPPGTHISCTQIHVHILPHRNTYMSTAKNKALKNENSINSFCFTI